MTTVALFACCQAAGADASNFIEHADKPPVVACGDRIGPAPDLPRDHAVASHESAHAIVGWLLGGDVLGIEIEPRRLATVEGLIGWSQALLFLAGPIGEGKGARFIRATPPDEIAETYARFWAGRAGRCDQCAAVLPLIVGDPDRSEARLIARWRAAERVLIGMFDEPQVERLLRAATRKLMQNGSMTGVEFCALATAIVPEETRAEVARSAMEGQN